MKMNMSYEQGPIRPPSEAQSLLIRVTRNCPWNKCAFCHTYGQTKFSLRPLSEIKKDIETVKYLAEEMKGISLKRGHAGNITEEVIRDICEKGYPPEMVLPVARWLYLGGETVFLQDANSLILKTADLIEVLDFIRKSLPSVKRITSYCRSHTARRKTLDELVSLGKAGLSRLHVGMESGFDPLLNFIKKGSTKKDHIEGGQKIKAAGISLCEYIMPGLGGKKWTDEHAQETAQAINEINPDHIRLRSTFVVKDTELFTLMGKGEFTPLDDEEVIKEIRRFVEGLENISSHIISDHILNLLEEIEGKLPEDKGRILAVIDRFFALSPEDRLIFRLGRRLGYYRLLADLDEPGLYRNLETYVHKYALNEPGRLDGDLRRIMQGFI